MPEIFYWEAGRPLPENEPFIVLLAGSTSDKQYQMSRNNSWEYVCAYIQSGKGTLVYDQRTYNLSQGDAFILHKRSNHVYYSDSESPFRFLWFNGTGNLIPLLLQAYGLDRQIIIPQYNDSSLMEEFHAICRSHTNPHEVYRLCALQFHRIVASFADYLAHMELTESLSYRIKRYLDEHLNEQLSLKKLAKQFGYSPEYIGRCFKGAYGQTPYQYLLNEKLIAAEKLLSQTDMKMRQIAALFGFNDEFHFSNTFYKHFGYRPKNFQKAHAARHHQGK